MKLQPFLLVIQEFRWSRCQVSQAYIELRGLCSSRTRQAEATIQITQSITILVAQAVVIQMLGRKALAVPSCQRHWASIGGGGAGAGAKRSLKNTRTATSQVLYVKTQANLSVISQLHN